MMKKLTVLVLAAVMLMSVCLPGYAAGEDKAVEYTGDSCPVSNVNLERPQPIELPYGPDKHQSEKHSAKGDVDEQKLFFELEKKIKAAILEGETRVDVSSYGIYPDSVNLSSIDCFSPYLSSDIELRGYYYTGSYYSHIQINSSLTPEEAAIYFAKVDSKVAEIKAIIDKAPTDMEKALALHDYLCYNAEYDMSGIIPESSYRCSGIIMNDIGVCNAYAYAFMYFMGLKGIECHVTSSDPMNHAWNIIKINGNYYHIDATWDDKTPDTLGKVYHDHFLVSDSAISQKRGNSSQYHYNWDRKDLVCSDTSLDNAFWTQVKSSIVDDGTNFYFIKDSGIYKRTKMGGAETKLLDLGLWKVWGGGGNWIGSFSGICLIGRDIYYNTATQIRKINVDSLSDSLVFSPDTSEGYVYGNAIKNGILRYVVKKDANDKGVIRSKDISSLLPKEGITVEPAAMELAEGESSKLSVIGSTQGLQWSSSDKTVATVSADGTVTGVKAGTATITAVNGAGSAASCTVTVSHTHSYENSVIEPDCENGGYTQHTCRCGDSYVTDETEPLGHSWDDGEVTKEPTEDEEGEKSFVCLRCGEIKTEVLPKSEHVHSFTSKIIVPSCQSEGYTEYSCDCGYTYKEDYKEPVDHWWNDGEITKEPSEEEEGEKTFTCFFCGETKTESIPAIEHIHTYIGTVTEPDCTEEGYTTYACVCGKSYIGSKLPAKGHSWDAGTVTKKPTEKEEGEKLFTCTVCGETKTEKLDVLDHTHIYVMETTAPTCTENGYTTYTCACGKGYVGSEVPAKGHKWDKGVITRQPTDSEPGEKLFTCTVCGETETESIPIPEHTHTYVGKRTDPTCTEDGYTTYSCLCGKGYVGNIIPAYGHDWDNGIVTAEPSETENGEKTYSCVVCGETKTEIIPALDHEHSYEAMVTAATCTEDGFTTYTCACGDSYIGDETPAYGHKWDDGELTKEPTEEEDGEKTFTCTVCGEIKTESIDSLVHIHGYVSEITAATCTEDGYTTYTCACGTSYISDRVPAKGHKWDKGVVTVQPTVDAEGEKTFSCAVCKETRTEKIDKLPDDTKPVENPFVDVSDGAYFFEPVMWAVSEGVTSGLSATEFGPSRGCTRAQVVTFLWRAAGEPAPESDVNPFRDVKEGAYYYDAVLWAVENGVTTGLSADTFGPNENCNRGQIVTFLWRAMNKPAPESEANPFTDVPEKQYYFNAVLWAVEEGITTGMSAESFAPNSTCTRGQIVTFLYRAYN